MLQYNYTINFLCFQYLILGVRQWDGENVAKLLKSIKFIDFFVCNDII